MKRIISILLCMTLMIGVLSLGGVALAATYDITVSSSPGGVVSNFGINTVSENGDLTVTITPYNNLVPFVSIDGASPVIRYSVTFTNVQAPHTVRVEFWAPGTYPANYYGGGTHYNYYYPYGFNPYYYDANSGYTYEYWYNHIRPHQLQLQNSLSATSTGSIVAIGSVSGTVGGASTSIKSLGKNVYSLTNPVKSKINLLNYNSPSTDITVRLSLPWLTIDTNAKGLQWVSAQELSSGGAYSAYTKIAASKRVSGPWSINASSSSDDLTLRFNVDTDKPLKNIYPVVWDAYEGKFVSVSGWRIVQNGSEYFVRIEGASTGTYALLSK